jgi:hypothetical protein
MTTPNKIDLLKLHKQEYKAGPEPTLVNIAPAQYLMIDGQGAPESPRFETCIGALYSAAYTIKMRCKAAGRTDYVVSKLECTWTISDEVEDFSEISREEWQWTLMIRTPEHITTDDLQQAVEVLKDKGKAENVQDVRLETLDEGTCIQLMHLGHYEMIHESALLMNRFTEQNNYTPSGKHHEIYISDPRRVAPEKLKTLLRQPVQKE